MAHRFLLSVAVLALLVQASLPAVAADKVYWPDAAADVIQRSDPDGANLETLITLSGPQGMAIDPVAGRMYWTRNIGDQVRRANLDGSNDEILVSGIADAGGFPYHIALDLGGGWMYWTSVFSTDGVYRARLDGSASAKIVGPELASGIALDLVNRHVYWGNQASGEIRRAGLDGSNPTTIFFGSGQNIEGLAIDVAAGKLYWADGGGNALQRANLDGSGFETVVSGTTGILGVALDLAAGKVYWSDSEANHVQRADLDGTNVENVATGLDFPRDVALDPPESVARVLTFSLGQATTSALAGGYPSSPPIFFDMLPPNPCLGCPGVLALDPVRIDLATSNCGTPVEVDSSMMASLPDAERVRLEVSAVYPPNPCIDDFELFFDMFPPDPVAPDPTVSLELLDFTPGGDRFDVYVRVAHDSGAVQQLHFAGAVGANQPPGAVVISDVTATPGSLDLDVEFTRTPSFNAAEPTLDVDLVGLEVVSTPSHIPALSGRWPILLAGVLAIAVAALLPRRSHAAG